MRRIRGSRVGRGGATNRGRAVRRRFVLIVAPPMATLVNKPKLHDSTHALRRARVFLYTQGRVQQSVLALLRKLCIISKKELEKKITPSVHI